MRTTRFLPFAFALFGAATAAVTSVTENSDVTVTVTSDYTQIVTVSEFIYTNAEGSLTTQAFTQGAEDATVGTTTSTTTGTASSSPAPTTTVAIPDGTYYTSTSQVTTTLEDGSSAVVEYVVYLTNTCAI